MLFLLHFNFATIKENIYIAKKVLVFAIKSHRILLPIPFARTTKNIFNVHQQFEQSLQMIAAKRTNCNCFVVLFVFFYLS